jgi:hypothetical protein
LFLIGLTGLIGFIGLIGLNGLVSRIGIIGLIGHIGLFGHIGLVGLIVLIELIRLVDFDITSFTDIISQTSLIGPLALLACLLVSPVSLAILMAHCQPRNFATVIIAALKISLQLKQAAAQGVDMVQTSATKIANVTISYYCTISLLYVSIHVRETMCWWLAHTKKKMW